VIRVAIPIDVGMIGATGSGAFALATPLRVGYLVALAIREALGARAPEEKRRRTVRTTLAGLAAGRFVVDVDGRLFRSPDDVVVCAGIVALRFFMSERRRQPAA
jgi:hypothetical protein